MKAIFLYLCFSYAALGQSDPCPADVSGVVRFKQPPSIGFTWPQTAEEASTITARVVLRFLQETCWRDEVRTPEDLHGFRFVDLETGKPYLVVAVPSGGTNEIPVLTAIRCEEEVCTPFGTDLWNWPDDFSQVFVSLRGDGVYQLVFGRPVGRPAGIYSDFEIYEMGSEGPYDASKKYRKWFDEHLYPLLEKQLNEHLYPGVYDVDKIAEYHMDAQYAMASYRLRVLGMKDAYLQYALEWASSPYWAVQESARTAVETAVNEPALVSSPVLDKVLDALEKSPSEDLRNASIEIRKELAQQRKEAK